MSKPSLEGIDLKLKRADQYLALLNDRITTFLNDEDRRVIGEFESETSEYVFRVTGDPPPFEWGLTVGEFAHCLRSGLDNLLWQVILARGGTPKDKVTQFPIFEHETPYDTGKAQRWTKGVSVDDWAFIEAAQPWHEGPAWNARHPLAMLADLNNVDKHRFVHVAYAAIGLAWPSRPIGPARIPLYRGLSALIQEATGVTTGVIVPDLTGIPHPVPVRDIADVDRVRFVTGADRDDRTELLRASIIPSGPHPEMKMEPRPTLDVSLSNAEQPMTLTDLGFIRDRVHEVVDHFRRLF